MYRDDQCAVCGEALPPDHLYCREHAAEVDDRLHEIGGLLPEVTDGLRRVAELLSGIAQETWEYLAEGEPGDPAWPPVPVVALRADAEAVDVDVDTEPGYVRVALRLPLPELLTALAGGLGELDAFARAARDAEGANATH